MVNHTMVFIARRFLIPAALQFVVITRYYASLRLITPCRKQKSTHSKFHSTEVFRFKTIRYRHKAGLVYNFVSNNTW
jgi:hypothetical protein